MIFEPASRAPVPSTDVISYLFSDPPYNHDDPIYVDVHNPSRAISYNQARNIVRHLIAGLRSWGLQKGDCVDIHSFNDIYYTMLVLAVVGAGGIFTGSNPAYTTMELSHHFRASETRFIITEPEYLGPVAAAAKEVKIPESRIRVFDVLDQEVPAGWVSWKAFFDHGEEDWVRFDDEDVARTTTAARLFSSGTTGLPKATAVTHRNFIAEHELVFELQKRPYRVSRLVPIPLFHAAAAPSSHFGSLKAGHVNYIMRRFDLALFLETMEKYQVTEVTVVPPMAIAIIMNPMSYERGYLRSVRASALGAAPIDKDAQKRFRALLGDGANCTQVWGMTETCCIATMFPWHEEDETGSVGRLIPNLEAKLVDDSGKNISAYGVRGEMCVRGPTVTPGYFNNPAANAESFDSDGWFHTGDIMYCDEETKKWYVVDRKKELIKVRGFQVAPPELEAVLISHPLIVDAAVIGLRNVVPGTELPRAYVVKRPGEGEKLTEEEVKKYLGERLARYKALTGGVKFVEAIPKNASGKILKKVLREESQREVETGLKSKL
ncbi:AMP-binding enzyme [Aspergillus ellipticus CBS 707.79]|uniref:AMP-binding enzyme n=1 Tax=Aspergillus ellipticus CBS 707.79 TaxID=1448320 RepID=A0A319DKE0_9EURO|nr:AMP-binding enzyme [Aspergillus ellipticus CBS 707.79]